MAYPVKILRDFSALMESVTAPFPAYGPVFLLSLLQTEKSSRICRQSRFVPLAGGECSECAARNGRRPAGRRPFGRSIPDSFSTAFRNGPTLKPYVLSTCRAWLLAQANHKPRSNDYLDRPSEEGLPSFIEPLPIHPCLQATVLEAEHGVRKERRLVPPCRMRPARRLSPIPRSGSSSVRILGLRNSPEASGWRCCSGLQPIPCRSIIKLPYIKVPVEMTPGTDLIRIAGRSTRPRTGCEASCKA